MELQLLSLLMKRRHELRRHERWSPSRLGSFQEHLLARLREYVYPRSPFYRRFHRGLFRAPLEDLPVLTKSLLMENFDDLVTDRTIHLKEVQEHLKRCPEQEKYLGRYWASLTSGSMGHPSINLFNDHEWATVLASGVRSYEWGGIKVRPFHRTRAAAIVSSKPAGMTARLTGTFHLWWFPTLRLFPDQPLGHIVERLNEWQPEILQTFYDVAVMLAEEQLNGRLRISPRVVAIGSGLLSKSSRDLLESVWSGRVFDRYGCGECGLIASECRQHEGLHIYQDLAIVEVVDQENRPAPPGELGCRVLVTALRKYTQPLIRYELPDLVRLSQRPCPCGRPFPLLEELHGRTDETLFFPSMSRGQVALPPDIFHRVMEGYPIVGYQIIHGKDGLRVLVRQVTGHLLENDLKDSLRLAISRMGAVPPTVRVERVSVIPAEPNGKSPLIKSLLTGNNSRGN